MDHEKFSFNNGINPQELWLGSIENFCVLARVKKFGRQGRRGIQAFDTWLHILDWIGPIF